MASRIAGASLLAVMAAQPLAAAEIYPLEVGRYWSYEMSGAESGTVTNIVTASQTLGDDTWYLMTEFGDEYWVRNAPDGQREALNLTLDAPEALRIDDRLIFKYPHEVGEIYHLSGDPVRVEEAREVIVPAGEFRCVVFTIDTGGGNYSRNCIAPGVGIIVNQFKMDDEIAIAKLVAHGMADAGTLSAHKQDAFARQRELAAEAVPTADQQFYQMMEDFTLETRAAVDRWNDSFREVQGPRVLDFGRLHRDDDFENAGHRDDDAQCNGAGPVCCSASSASSLPGLVGPLHDEGADCLDVAFTQVGGERHHALVRQAAAANHRVKRFSAGDHR